MRQLTVVGISEDGTHVVLTTAGSPQSTTAASPPVAGDGGEPAGEFTIALDDRLRAATRGDRARLGQLQIQFESSLRPRDIQARIRAGETPEEVARVAGIPVDRVLRFAAPVLAEREHVVDEARSHPLHRRSEPGGLSLDDAVTAKLSAHGVDPTTVAWDARRRTDGGWVVTTAYRGGSRDRTATFRFDPATRTAIADDDDARWIAGDTAGPGGPHPGPASVAAAGATRALAPADAFDAMVAAELAAAAQVRGPEGIGRDGAPLPDADGPTADRSDAATDGAGAGIDGDEATIDVPFAGRWPEMPAPTPVTEASGEQRSRPMPSRPRTFGRRERTPSRPPTGSAETRPATFEPATFEPAAVEPAAPAAPAAEPVAEPVAATATEGPEAAEQTPERTPVRNRRQAVPSWDEIMFGRKGD
jgi:hypothetical protein